jgi:hypothetical protein
MGDMYVEQRNVDHSNNLQQAIKCLTFVSLQVSHRASSVVKSVVLVFHSSTAGAKYKRPQ